MKQPQYRTRQSGFTLIELMVSMALGLLILSALIALMLNVSRNNSEMTKTNRVIENGRFALQLLQADLSHAGYWGGFVPEFDDLSLATAPTDIPKNYPGVLPVVTEVPDPCASWADLAANIDPVVLATYKSNLIGIPVQSYEIPAVVPSPTLSVCANRIVSPKAKTDVLIVRGLERSANCNPAIPATIPATPSMPGGCPLPSEGDLYAQVALCGSGSTRPVPAYELKKYATTSFATDFPGKQRSTACAAAASAELRKFVSNIYYVRDYSTPGDNIPTLMRSQFYPKVISGVAVLQHQSAEALIEGVEGFRVEFGIDNRSDAGTDTTTASLTFPPEQNKTKHHDPISWANTMPANTSPTNRGDGSPDGAYVHCTTLIPCTTAQLMNTVAVKLYVLIRSDEVTPGYKDVKTYNLGSTTLGPFNDGYKRHLFTQTIRLVNVSSRRETP